AVFMLDRREAAAENVLDQGGPQQLLHDASGLVGLFRYRHGLAPCSRSVSRAQADRKLPGSPEKARLKAVWPWLSHERGIPGRFPPAETGQIPGAAGRGTGPGSG